MSGTCKTCRHWRNDDDRFGICDSGQIRYDVAAFYNRLAADASMLFYSDAEEYNAHHMVGKDFGCLYHEPKPVRDIEPTDRNPGTSLRFNPDADAVG